MRRSCVREAYRMRGRRPERTIGLASCRGIEGTGPLTYCCGMTVWMHHRNVTLRALVW